MAKSPWRETSADSLPGASSGVGGPEPADGAITSHRLKGLSDRRSLRLLRVVEGQRVGGCGARNAGSAHLQRSPMTSSVDTQSGDRHGALCQWGEYIPHV